MKSAQSAFKVNKVNASCHLLQSMSVCYCSILDSLQLQIRQIVQGGFDILSNASRRNSPRCHDICQHRIAALRSLTPDPLIVRRASLRCSQPCKPRTAPPTPPRMTASSRPIPSRNSSKRRCPCWRRCEKRAAGKLASKASFVVPWVARISCDRHGGPELLQPQLWGSEGISSNDSQVSTGRSTRWV